MYLLHYQLIILFLSRYYFLIKTDEFHIFIIISTATEKKKELDKYLEEEGEKKILAIERTEII